MKFRVTAIALALATAFPFEHSARAEDTDAQLKETMVTATRTEKVVSEAPASVTVVTSREIANKNAHRIEEALAGTAGVFVRGLSGEQPSNYQNQITLRGIPGYYRTGVLVDGVAINNAFSGGVNMSLVPVEDVQQIEVVPGPFSSLYGGAGMSGVVNIITKVPEKRQISVRGDMGSHDFKSLELGYRDKLSEAVGLSASYGHKESDGYVSDYVTKTTPSGAGGGAVTGWQRTTTATGATSYIVGDKGRTAWKQDNYGAKLFLTLSPVSRLVLDAAYLSGQTLAGQGNSYLVRAGAPVTNGGVSIDGKNFSVAATDFLNATNGEYLSRYGAAYETRFAGDFKLKANLSYQDNRYWYTQINSGASTGGSGKLSDIPADKLDGDVQVGFPVGASQYLLVGGSFNDSSLHKKVYTLASWRNREGRGTLGDWADGNSRSLAVYAQDEIGVGDRLTLYMGARYDYWTTDGIINNAVTGVRTNYDSRASSALSPKASAVYRLDSATVVKGAIGKAFRAPNLSDMYSTYSAGTTTYWSSPDLRPEKVTTAELSVERQFATGTLVRATFYRSDITNLIYSAVSGSNSYKFNAGTAEAEGVDLELRQKLGAGLTAFANTSLVETTITANSVRASSVGKQIPLQSRKIANLGIEGARGDWSGSVIASYVGKMYGQDDNTDTVSGVPGSYDAYFVTNAKISYRIDKTLTASLSINNLFDREYFLNTSKADGRAVFVGLGFKY